MQEIRLLKEDVIQAALKLAAEKNWNDISLYKISVQAGYEETEVHALFDDKEAIVAAYVHKIDEQIAENFKDMAVDGEGERDRLFDVLMDRFDLLNEDKAAVLSIVNAVTLDPVQSVHVIPIVARSMTSMLGIAGVETDGFKGAVKIAVLTGIWLKTLRVWMNDDTADMAATMAALDKSLGYFEKIG